MPDHRLKKHVDNPAYLDQELADFLALGQVYRFQKWMVGKDAFTRDKIAKYVGDRIYEVLRDSAPTP